MASELLSDAEVFGDGELLSDADVFGGGPLDKVKQAAAAFGGAMARLTPLGSAAAASLRPPVPIRSKEDEAALGRGKLLEKRSVLDAPGEQSGDPMLRQEFVQQVRDSFANVPAEIRLPALRNMAQNFTDVRGRAAKVILADEEARNATGSEKMRTDATRGALLTAARAPAPGAAGRVEFLDSGPTLPEIAEGATAKQVMRRRQDGRALADDAHSPETIASDARRQGTNWDSVSYAADNPVFGGAASGLAKMAAGGLNTPSAAAQFLSEVLLSQDARRTMGVGRVPNMPLVEGLMQNSREWAPAVMTQEPMEAWDKNQFGTWLAANMAAQAPQFAAQMVAFLIPPARAMVLPAMGAQSAGVSYAEGDSGVVSVAKGGIEAGSELLKLKVLDKAREFFVLMPSGSRASAAREVGRRVAAATAGIAVAKVGEGGTEAVSQLGQNAIDRFTGKDTPLSEGVLASAILGAVSGAGHATPVAIHDLARSNRPAAMFDRALSDDIASGSFSQEGIQRSALGALHTGEGNIDPRLTTKPIIRAADMPTTPFTPEQVDSIAQAAAAQRSAIQPAQAPGTDLGVTAVSQGSLANIADQQLRARSALPDVPVSPVVAVPAPDAAGDQPGGSGAVVGRVADARGAGALHAGLPTDAGGGSAAVAAGARGLADALTSQPNAAAQAQDTTSPTASAPTPGAAAPSDNGFAVGGGLRTQEVPLSSITLSKDVPQFKSGANAAGVVEPLGGAYDRTGTAPIQLWERTDGRLEVISGRHRLDLAQRSGEETIPAQVHREADGFDTRMASRLDSELNIRDGQGKVRDYVDYFKAANIDRATAEHRGLLARAVGKRAYSIATDGGDEVISAHRAGQLTDEAAVAIAESAPGDSRLQAVGIRAVQDGKSIAQAANTVRAVKLMAGEQADTTGDMFGFDDSAMREAEQMAKIATARQRELSQRLVSITGAAKNPALAKAEGVNVKDPSAVLKRAEQIRRERSEWDNWPTNPRLVAEIRAEIRGEPVAGPSAAPTAESMDAAPAANQADLSSLPQAPSAHVFGTKGEATVYAVQEGIQARVQAEAVDGGAVLAPRIKAPNAAQVESDQRSVDGVAAAMGAAGWRHPNGTKWRLKIADRVPAPVRSAIAVTEAVFGIRVIPVTGAPGNGIQWNRVAVVDVGKAATAEVLIGHTGHEVKHWLDANDPAAAKILDKAIALHLKPDALARQQAKENAGLLRGEKPVDAARARLEIGANINGAMWMDSAFWARLYELDNGSTFRKVLYQFMRHATRLISVAQGSTYDAGSYVTDVAAVREAAAQAWAQRANKPTADAGSEQLVRGARRGRPSVGDQELFADPPAPRQPTTAAAAAPGAAGDFELIAPTKADVLAQQKARTDEAKAETTGRRQQEEQARKDREQRDISDRRRQDASADGFQLGQNADDALSGQSSLFEPGAPYETDLFGDPLPNRPGRSDSGRIRQRAGSGKLHATATVPGDPTAPAGNYATRTHLVTTRQQQLGYAGQVATLGEAASALSYLNRSAVERLDVLVTDQDGRPLAVVGGFKGGLGQTSVFPATIVGEVMNIRGAAYVWLVHNHPSGTAVLSAADKHMERVVADVFAGTAVTSRGVVAVTGDRWAGADSGNGLSTSGALIAGVGPTVPAHERQIAANGKLGPPATSPADAKRLVRDEVGANEGRAVLLLLDSQHAPIAAVPWAGADAMPIKGNGKLDALYRAVSYANAGSALIGTGSDMTMRQAQNLAAGLAKIDVRVLDIIDSAGRSAAEQGDTLAAPVLLSRNGRETNDPWFSALHRAVKSLPMGAAPAQGWKDTIKGLVAKGTVKADEVEWTGLYEWLDLQTGKVTKAQVAEYLSANGVQVTETVLGSSGPQVTQADIGAAEARGDWAEHDRLTAIYEDQQLGSNANGTGNETKYGQYQLPGGTNYREVLLTLPRNETTTGDVAQRLFGKSMANLSESERDEVSAEMRRIGDAKRPDYKSGHWDQPNVLAHIRLNDRTDADGKRVLFVEEMQSDWQQQRRKNLKMADESGSQMVRDGVDKQTPPAPFIDATDKWVALALKRVIKMAVDEGYDKVAFVTGEQSADRYDLSKQVDSISYRKDADIYRLRAKPISGGEMVDLGNLKAEELDGAVGKEVAKKIIDGEGSQSGDMTILSGVDLKVGGEGMKAFYDKIVPAVAKDVLRKLGGGAMEAIYTKSGLYERGQFIMEAGESWSARNWAAAEPGREVRGIGAGQPSFDITDAMREKAAGGLPLFSRSEPLSAEDRAIERRLQDKIAADFDAAVVEYNARPDAMGGKVLNTDIARELSSDYMANRTKSAAVHEPASQFIKDLYARKLAQLPKGATVAFTSGGTGSGKTTGINDVPSARAVAQDADVVYDTNMNTLGSAAKKIEQALDAGSVVAILHVQRDPVESLVKGALHRAMSQAEKFGTGRTVPLVEHARTHRGAAEVIQQLAARYKGDSRVDIQIIDNTHGKGNARAADLGFVRGFDYNGIEEKLYDALKQEHDAGRISSAVFRATEGDADPGAGPLLRADVRGQPEPQRVGGGREGRGARGAESHPTELNSPRAADPFADSYKALDGHKVSFDVLIQDSGKTARFTVDAGQYMRDLDNRLSLAEKLRGCVAG